MQHYSSRLLDKELTRRIYGWLMVVAFFAIVSVSSPIDAHELEKVSLPDGTSASISEMKWLSGVWQTQFGETTLEENWVSLRSNMLGAFLRYMKDGKVTQLESITFEQRDGAIVQRMRQFNLDLEPLIPTHMLKMVSHRDGKFVFETTNESPVRKVIYEYAKGRFRLTLNDSSPITFDRH